MDVVLPVDQARRTILGQVQPLAPIDLPLAEVSGCVIAADVMAEYDIPAYSSAETDGYACRAADVHGATREVPALLRISGWALSGRPPDATVGWGEAVRVAAGAPLPAGADCVVPLDRCDVEGETVQVFQPAQPEEFVRPSGDDLRAGEILVPAGRRLSAPELGVLAAAGYGSALAYPKVRVAVLAVGAVIEPGAPAPMGSVRDAGSYALLAAVRDLGAVPYRIGIVTDVESDLREALLSNLVRADAFLVAGGIPPGGDGEVLAKVLSGLGQVDTYQVAMHPGSALGFGLVEGKPFFALPAEAAGLFVQTEVFVRPALLRMMGRRDLSRPEVKAILEGEVTGPQDTTLFGPARVTNRDGGWRATPTGPLSPGLLGTVVKANGLIVIPPGDTTAGPGQPVRVQVFRALER